LDHEAARGDPDEPVYHVIGVGGFIGALLQFLRWFQRPAVALGGRSLYRVMLEGGGFELPGEPSDPPVPHPAGFYTTRFVAARTRTEAEALAKAHVIAEWQGLSLWSHFTGVEEPTLKVSESGLIDGWFKRSKGQGFTFFNHDGEP
jgi:hypothetical protein